MNMSNDDSEEERYESRAVTVKTGGSSTGLIVGGVVVLGIAGVVGWYLYTGFKTEQDYIDAVRAYQNCIEQALDEGHTIEEAEAICWGYRQAVEDLGDKLAHGFGYWVDVAIKDLSYLGIVGIGIGITYITYKIVERYHKNHGGGGGTPEQPYHDFNDNTNWTTSVDFVTHCLFDYGTPHYDNPALNPIWSGVQAMPEWEKEMLAGFLESQGIPNAYYQVNTNWDSLPTGAKIALVGLLIAGLLIICTVSLGAAVPEALPLAYAAIAAV